MRAQLLRRVEFARSLDGEVVDALAERAVESRVERGTVITVEGELAEAMYVVAEGRVKISRYSIEGREQIMHTAEAGDHFNAVPIFDGGLCPATAEAVIPTRLLVLPREHVLEVIQRYPQLATTLLREFAGRLRMLVGLVEDLALHTVHGRLARLLLQQAEAAERGEPQPAMTQAEMAALLGTVREMVSRTLRAFEMAELIAMERGAIRILDREGLRARADM